MNDVFAPPKNDVRPDELDVQLVQFMVIAVDDGATPLPVQTHNSRLVDPARRDVQRGQLLVRRLNPRDPTAAATSCAPSSRYQGCPVRLMRVESVAATVVVNNAR